jgi:Na+-driven multidrug efflux pump
MTIVVVFTAARIPLAWWLSGVFGLEAVWWTIAGTCALKGLLLWGAFAWRSRREDWGAGGRLA